MFLDLILIHSVVEGRMQELITIPQCHHRILRSRIKRRKTEPNIHKYIFSYGIAYTLNLLPLGTVVLPPTAREQQRSQHDQVK